ncbi:universal stress protein [Saccharopolyspora sp. ASAGF58]
MTEDKPRIVVGVDGSPGSQAALRWALRYAEQSNGRVSR